MKPLLWSARLYWRITYNLRLVRFWFWSRVWTEAKDQEQERWEQAGYEFRRAYWGKSIPIQTSENVISRS